MPLVNTDIANMALGHIGGGRIDNVDQDRSSDAALVRTYFDVARRAELETYDWSFARRFQALPEDTQDAVGQWQYAYIIPADCLAARRLQKDRTIYSEQRIPYELAASDDGVRLLLMTNMPEAVLRYTFDQKNVATFTTNFVMALSHRLAAYIGYAKTKKANVQQTQFGLAAVSRRVAQGLDANAAQVDKPPPLADWTLARERSESVLRNPTQVVSTIRQGTV